MDDTNSLNIKVVYDASKTRRRKPVRAPRRAAKTAGASKSQTRPAKKAPAARVRRTQASRLMPLLSALVAVALCVATWRIDKHFIYANLMLRTPIPGVDLSKVADIMFSPEGDATPPGNMLETQPNTAGQVGESAVPEPLAGDGNAGRTAQASVRGEPAQRGSNGATVKGAKPKPLIAGRTATVMIPVTAYGWLTLSTVAAYLLALFAGAGLGRGMRPIWRRIGVALAVAGTAAVAWEAYRMYSQFGMQFSTDKWRQGMIALCILMIFVGLGFSGWAGRLRRPAAVVIIVAALGSVVALCIGRLCGAVDGKYVAPHYLALVFTGHSIWGWLLLLSSRRAR